MPLIYYRDEAAPSSSCNDNGSKGGKESNGNSEGSVKPGSSSSTYAGVFESGCDPAQLRASLNHGSRRSSATPVHHSKYTSQNEQEEIEDQNSAPVDVHHPDASFTDDGEAECLFEMEGIRDSVADHEANNDSTLVCGVTGESDADPIVNVNASYDESARASAVGSVLHSSREGDSRAISREALPAAGAASSGVEKPMTVMSKGAPASHHLRQTRVIGPGPGTRCVRSGMYRLRLSTSC